MVANQSLIWLDRAVRRTHNSGLAAAGEWAGQVTTHIC